MWRQIACYLFIFRQSDIFQNNLSCIYSESRGHLEIIITKRINSALIVAMFIVLHCLPLLITIEYFPPSTSFEHRHNQFIFYQHCHNHHPNLLHQALATLWPAWPRMGPRGLKTLYGSVWVLFGRTIWIWSNKRDVTHSTDLLWSKKSDFIHGGPKWPLW